MPQTRRINFCVHGNCVFFFLNLNLNLFKSKLPKHNHTTCARGFRMVAGQLFGVTYLNPNGPKIGRVDFTSDRLDRRFQLDLRKNDDLFDDKFVILKRTNGKSEIIDNGWNDTDCYYHSFSPHVAALDVCNGLVNETKKISLFFPFYYYYCFFFFHSLRLFLFRGAFSSRRKTSITL